MAGVTDSTAIDPNRHPGEGRDLDLALNSNGETPAFAGVTKKGT